MSDRTPGQRYQSQPSPNVPPEPTAGVASSQTFSPQTITPQRYRSHAPLLGILIAVVVVALAAALVWVGTRPPSAVPSSSSTQNSSVEPAPTYTPSPNWQGIEFSAPSYQATGYWQVSPPLWDGDTVTVSTTVAVDQGTMRFTFFALDNQASDLYTPDSGTMQAGSVQPGGSQTGTLTMTIPRGDFTLYLATARGTQVAALVVSG
ncbi:MAG: hypothetical protein FWD80_00855 [Propionibacteriaceae bacterium]|nr:hypothetical protein [Propionibacteriaceae bacterium]